MYWLGSVVAAILSYQWNGNILWAIFHAFFSWFYVIYAILAH